jgi:hypothetical protein
MHALECRSSLGLWPVSGDLWKGQVTDNSLHFLIISLVKVVMNVSDPYPPPPQAVVLCWRHSRSSCSHYRFMTPFLRWITLAYAVTDVPRFVLGLRRGSVALKATSREVTDSSPDEVNVLSVDVSLRSQWALEFTQPLTEMNTRGRTVMFLGSRAAAGA